MRRIGNQSAVRSKHSARKVKSLLDVGGNGGSLENSAHLLCKRQEKGSTSQTQALHLTIMCFCSVFNVFCTCYAHEAVREDGELDGVELGAEGAAAVGTNR